MLAEASNALKLNFCYAVDYQGVLLIYVSWLQLAVKITCLHLVFLNIVVDGFHLDVVFFIAGFR
jgi:hypothetical protein